MALVGQSQRGAINDGLLDTANERYANVVRGRGLGFGLARKVEVFPFTWPDLRALTGAAVRPFHAPGSRRPHAGWRSPISV